MLLLSDLSYCWFSKIDLLMSLTTDPVVTADTNMGASNQTEAPTISATTPASFTVCSIHTSQLGTFRYWLYTPSDPTENMPLIVYLHDGSGKGDDLNLITDVDGFPQYLQSGELGDVRAYVIIPQLPSTQKGWVNAAEAISDLIDQTASTYKIDKNNISLTGHSMGGTGTWNPACTYIPVTGAGTTVYVKRT